MPAAAGRGARTRPGSMSRRNPSHVRSTLPMVPGTPCDPRHSPSATDSGAAAGLDADAIATSPGECLMSEPFETAVVTGASRGFGRAIAAALVARGTSVVGIARGEDALRAVARELGPGFTSWPGDATDDSLALDVIRKHRPGLLVLNAGAIPHMAPLPEQTWETFSRNWHADTRHAFTWTRAALTEPLAPGSVVV